MTDKFDGFAGKLVAPIMARMNAAAEAEAIDLLDAADNANILVLGFGPGVGIEMLAKRIVGGTILGIDPSNAMMKAAAKRNEAMVKIGRVRLERTTANAISAAPASFDGVIAVNTIQLCEPIAPTLTELARVMRPGATLVTITHDWAAAHHAGTADAWMQMMSNAFAGGDFERVEIRRGKSEKGKAIIIRACKKFQ